MKFIIFLFDLDPSSGQDVFHGGAIELCIIFVELAVREEFLLEGVDGGFLVVEQDGNLLMFEASNIVA